MMRTYDFISAPADKQTINSFLPNNQCCSYFAPLPLDVTNFTGLPQMKESVLYLVKTDTKKTVQRAFLTELLNTKPHRSADLCGPL